MSWIYPALAFSPILLCGSLILFFRRTAIIGALSGLLLALFLILSITQFPLSLQGAQNALYKTFILVLSAALVIVPGIYFNSILRCQCIVQCLVTWVQGVHIEAELKALILLFGVLPAIESLTGFGVSCFLAVPIFFRLFTPDIAFRLTMLGMNIVPWGALALPTIVAASLTGYSPTSVGSMSALTSSLVFPTIGIIALYVMGREPLIRRYGVVAVLLASALALFLYLFNRLGFAETGGLLAGGLVSVLAFLCAALPGSHHTVGPDDPVLPLPKLRILFPYLLVLALLFVMRMVTPVSDWLSNLWVLSADQVKLSVFMSPGIALSVTVLVMHLRQPGTILHGQIWRKIQVALSSLFCFVLLGQIMNESHMIEAAASALGSLKQEYGLLLLLSTMLGVMSGFVTGSNVGANALVMGVQQQIGQFAGDSLLFIGLQNSAAGQVVFTSLPIIVLIIAIVRDNFDEGAEKVQLSESELLKFGLKVMTVIYAALLISIILALLTGQYVDRPFS